MKEKKLKLRNIFIKNKLNQNLEYLLLFLYSFILLFLSSRYKLVMGEILILWNFIEEYRTYVICFLRIIKNKLATIIKKINGSSIRIRDRQIANKVSISITFKVHIT